MPTVEMAWRDILIALVVVLVIAMIVRGEMWRRRVEGRLDHLEWNSEKDTLRPDPPREDVQELRTLRVGYEERPGVATAETEEDSATPEGRIAFPASREQPIRAGARREAIPDLDHSDLSPIEREIAEAYEGATVSSRFPVTDFGVTNIAEVSLGRQQTCALGPVKRGHYWLIEAQGDFYVVPRPGLPLDRDKAEYGALSDLFEVHGIDLDASQFDFKLVRPARVSQTGVGWVPSTRGIIVGPSR